MGTTRISDTEAASDFINLLTKIRNGEVAIIESGGVPVAVLHSAPDANSCKLRLEFLKDQIAAQANVFDAIDSKTGVALGFTFVVVGQVLASAFRLATDQSHFQSSHPILVGSVFGVASVLVFIGTVCGAGARWPRVFEHSVEWSEEDLSDTYMDTLVRTNKKLEKIAEKNDATNISKGRWAKWTYLSLGLALLAYLLLTVFLFCFSVPSH